MIDERKEDIKKLEKKLEKKLKNEERNDKKKKLEELINKKRNYLLIAEKEKEESESITFEEFLKSDKKEYVDKYYYLENWKEFSNVDWFTDLIELRPNQEGFLPDEYVKPMLVLRRAREWMRKELKKVILENGNSELLENRGKEKEYIKDLKKEKEEQVDKIKDIRKNVVLMWGFQRSEMDEMTKEFEDRIKEIDEEINDILNNSITDKDLDKFVEALENIFEHINIMLNKGINGVSDEDMLHLIKLTTFELIKSPSESLDIKLFEGLKKVFYDFGTPKGNWTPVWTVRGFRPSH